MHHLQDCIAGHRLIAGHDRLSGAGRLNLRGWLDNALLCIVAGCLYCTTLSAQVSTAELLDHPTTSWLTNGGNLYNQRYSPLTDINTDNVRELKGVWHIHLEGSGVGAPYSGEAQPIIHDGTIYIVTGANDVFAVDIDTGHIRWRYRSNLDPAISTICCGWTSRGVALGDGKLYLGRLDSKLVALNLTDGTVAWEISAARWQDGYTITGAPLFVDGKVITGFAGAEYGVRGMLRAFNASDGAPLWTFHTVPAPGERGAETWPADSDAWRRGGATVWHTPAVDPELGLLYFATGNPGPDFNGAVRAGDNLYSVSIVALNLEDGSYRWHFQQVHHDIWDYDAANPVVLFDLNHEGKHRKALAQAGKTGWVYILDRTSGTPLLGIDEVPVPQERRQLTAATQPQPVGDAFVPQAMEMPLYGYDFANQGKIFTPYFDRALPIKPSSFGAAVWAPSSYDPGSHTLFICAMDLIGLFVGGADDDAPVGQQYLGGQFIYDNVRNGIFAAMDLRTNKLRWRQRWRDSCYSGSTATAGGIVFTGQNDGRFVALDADNGDALWEFQTGAGVNAPPAVFEHHGKQYVAVYAAGALFAQSPPGDSVWLFALDGTLDELPDPTGPSAAEALFQEKHTDADNESNTRTALGATVFARNCSHCHGAQGQGGHGGGPALGSVKRARLLEMIAQGNEKMPGFGNSLTYDEVHALLRYIEAAIDD